MNIKLLDTKELKSFPSGSGIEFFEDTIYLIGDDAKDVLLLTTKWKPMERISIFESPLDRIPKKIKSDLEATTIVLIEKVPHLLILGSGSRELLRNKAVLLNLKKGGLQEIDLTVFYGRLRESGIRELNIEGAALVDDKIIFSNRGNKNRPDNKLIITTASFWANQADAELLVLSVDLEQKPGIFSGISGLTYSQKNDWLVFTASTENTMSSFADNPIGDSYLGVIENVSRKIGRKKMKVNSLINLSEEDKKFKGKKVESVCIQSDKENRAKMHLVADNDTGVSYLFKVRLKG